MNPLNQEIFTASDSFIDFFKAVRHECLLEMEKYRASTNRLNADYETYLIAEGEFRVANMVLSMLKVTTQCAQKLTDC